MVCGHKKNTRACCSTLECRTLDFSLVYVYFTRENPQCQQHFAQLGENLRAGRGVPFWAGKGR